MSAEPLFVKDELGAQDSWEWDEEFLHPDLTHHTEVYVMCWGERKVISVLVKSFALATAFVADTSTTVKILGHFHT